MLVVSKKPINGTEKKGETPQTPVLIPAIAASKKESPVFKEEEIVISLEDKIYQNQILTDLIERREKIMDSLKKLQSFKLAADSNRDSILISDGYGNEFRTSNTDAVKNTMDLIKSSLQTKLQSVESSIITL